MTKKDFIKALNHYYKENDKLGAIGFVNNVTKLSTKFSTDLVKGFWACSADKVFGQNIYSILETTAEGSEFNPKTKNSCSVYLVYPDEHAAAFALFKIKQYK